MLHLPARLLVTGVLLLPFQALRGRRHSLSLSSPTSTAGMASHSKDTCRELWLVAAEDVRRARAFCQVQNCNGFALRLQGLGGTQSSSLLRTVALQAMPDNPQHPCRSHDDSLSASELAAQHASKAHDSAAPSAEALGSVMCLLEACLSTAHMPTPEEAVTEAQKDGGQSSVSTPGRHVSPSQALQLLLLPDARYDRRDVGTPY